MMWRNIAGVKQSLPCTTSSKQQQEGDVLQDSDEESEEGNEHHFVRFEESLMAHLWQGGKKHYTTYIC